MREFSYSIASLRIALTVSGFAHSMLDAIAAKYALFECREEQPPHVSLTLEYDASVPKHAGGPVVSSTQGKQRIVLPSLAATLDVSTAPVRVTASMAGETLHPLENLLRLLLSRELLARGGLLIHAAAIADGGVSYLFPGISEAGKTTMGLRAGRGKTLSDELPAVTRQGEGFRAWATPFWGDMGHGEINGDAPLRAVCLLDGKHKRTCRRVDEAEALQRVLSTAWQFDESANAAAVTVETCAVLVRSVPVLALATDLEEPFASVRERIEQALLA